MDDFTSVRQCYERSASAEAHETGEVSIAWTIAPSGSVTRAESTKDTLSDPSISTCIREHFLVLRFPTSDASTDATWTFSFKPSKR